MQKPADTDYPVLEAIAQRWSPRAFSDKPVEAEKLCSLFEAARWTASAFNEQPWRFIVATKDNPNAFAKALACLAEANQGWAQHASVLVLTVCSTQYKKNGNDNRVAQYDLGQAVSSLAIQAADLGLSLHQMAGIDLDKVRESYSVPEGFVPQTAIAIGYDGDPDTLEGWAADAERAPRNRNDFNTFIFADEWEQASGLFE